MLETLPQVLPGVSIEGDNTLLALLLHRLDDCGDRMKMARSISQVCCVVDGLFKNRQRGSTSPMTRSPIETEFVNIASNWNDYQAIFNEFSRVQDLLIPLACYSPSGTTREEVIQSMNQCLHAIVGYSSFLLVPSLLQNSLLLYTQLVHLTMHQYSDCLNCS